MSDAVKEWSRSKPFKRINNDDFRPKTPADGLGIACGCAVPSQFPDRVAKFDDEFKNFKPDSLQRVIREAHDIAKKVGTGISIASAILGVFGGLAGVVAAIATAKKIDDVVNDVLQFVDNTITKLLKRVGHVLLERAIGVIPHWVPVVKGASNQSVEAEQIIEVEGVAVRSYMNPIDVPFRQWHVWFDWNVVIAPEAEYANALSPAHNPPNTDGALFPEEGPITPESPSTIEVQWDAGAMWSGPLAGDFESIKAKDDPGAMAMYDGPMLVQKFFWPVKDSYVWAAGRWVYDCSRTTTTDPPMMCAMVNPCKAVATARWGAFKFEENDYAVPAIQFLFFACRRGGYIDYSSIRDQDYEFILDLPPIDMHPRAPFPIGHTGFFPHNTLVLRPRLLVDVDQQPFKDTTGTEAIEPVVSIIRPDDPDIAPSQVKVRVPLTSLPDTAEACGFILSLGWFDPDLEQAKKVKKCTVTVKNYSGLRTVRNSVVKHLRDFLQQEEHELLKDIHDEVGKIVITQLAGRTILVKDIPILGPQLQNVAEIAVEKIIDFLGDTAPFNSEHWLFRMGVNGQWASFYLDTVKESERLLTLPPIQYNLLLSEDDLLTFAVNGADFGPVGSMMRDPGAKRMLEFDGHTPKWAEIVTPDDDPDRAREKHLKMAIAYALALLHKGPSGMGLGADNQPLGFVDPVTRPDEVVRTGAVYSVGEIDNSNPLALKRTGGLHGVTKTTAPVFARALEPQKILIENVSGKDYIMHYELDVEDQLTAEGMPARAATS